jgi:phosphotriesterase-related protein
MSSLDLPLTPPTNALAWTGGGDDTEMMIPTARGDDVSSSDLGFTLMHEHTFTSDPEVNLNYPETWGDDDARVADAVRQYRELHTRGVDTIVDLTVIGLGRNVARVKRVAEQVDLNIIVATGIYTWNMLPMYFNARGPGSVLGGPEFMDDLFVRDITDGIAGTGVRAGILKVATDRYGLTEGVERALRAVASAHRRTGVPITTHTHDVPNGLDQQRVFEEEGVDLSRVVIGHIDVAASHDLDYVEAILAKGSYVGFDQFGIPFVTNEARMEAIVELCRRGRAHQIVLSHDHNCYCDTVPQEWFENMPDWRKTFLVDEIIPALLARGVTPEQIKAMTRTNPRRIFETTALGPYG